jgi:hypothetical protein
LHRLAQIIKSKEDEKTKDEEAERIRRLEDKKRQMLGQTKCWNTEILGCWN